jgi:hypothetical protein
MIFYPTFMLSNIILDQTHQTMFNFCHFYLSHMEYERSIDFVTVKKKKKIANFHVLELFTAKKQYLSKKKFRLSRAVAPLKARMLKFWLP